MLKLVTGPEFVAGLIAGLLVAGAAVLRHRTPRFPRLVPLVGVVLGIGLSVALAINDELPALLPVAFALLVYAGVAIDLGFKRWVVYVCAVMAVTGVVTAAFVIFRGGDLMADGRADWLAAALTAFVGIAALRYRYGVFAWLITAGGVLVGVPDTEEALVLTGILVVPAVVAAVLRIDVLDKSSGVLLSGAVAWVIASGGWSRPAAMTAAIGTYGIMLVIPLVVIAKWRFGRQLHEWASTVWRGRGYWVDWMRVPITWMDTRLDGWALYTHVVIAFLSSRFVAQTGSVGFAGFWIVLMVLVAGFAQVQPRSVPSRA